MNNCICYCIDNNDYNNRLLYCSLYSLRKYNKTKVFIMTVNDNKYVDKFKKFDDVEIYFVDELYNQKYKNIKAEKYVDDNQGLVEFRNDISNMAFFRLEIPNILKDFDKVLYLDTDTEIKRNLDPIFDMDFEGFEIIGQYNREPHLLELVNTVNEIGFHSFDYILQNKSDYICSGIMLFNNKALRNENYDDRLNLLLNFEYNYYNTHLWKDEFLINLGFKCKSSKLLDCEDEREYKTTEELETNSYIVHYIWIYKNNFIEKYKSVLEKESLS